MAVWPADLAFCGAEEPGPDWHSDSLLLIPCVLLVHHCHQLLVPGWQAYALRHFGNISMAAAMVLVHFSFGGPRWASKGWEGASQPIGWHVREDALVRPEERAFGDGGIHDDA